MSGAKKKHTVDDLRPAINGCADEVTPFAQEYARDYFKTLGGPLDAKRSLPDFESNLADACNEWCFAGSGTPEARAALLRLAANALLVLAVDELARGEDACADIAERLDAQGHLKPRQARASAKPKKPTAKLGKCFCGKDLPHHLAEFITHHVCRELARQAERPRRRDFWERVFIATFVPERQTWIGPQQTIVVDTSVGFTVSPLMVAIGAADQALVEWDKRWGVDADRKAAAPGGGA